MKWYKHLVLFIALFNLSYSFIQAQTKDTSVTFTVYGLCDQCKNRIETAAKIHGVSNADWNTDSHLLSVSYNTEKTSLDKIEKRILAAGHDLANKKATDDAYNALPSCCKYRAMENTAEAKTATAIVMNDIPNMQHTIKGFVLEVDNKGSFKPLIGASVYWLNTTDGTVTDTTGMFQLAHKGYRLVISYTGYEPDTVNITDMQELKVVLAQNNQLKDVKVTASQRNTYINALSVYRTQVMTDKELFKAACCNLSESFETNPSVDVAYNDAVTGSKQIQLLGLNGSYTQLLVENVPGPRGISATTGFDAIAGPWVESIQLTKGIGSVANGFESIAGQINVELKKPETAEQLYANAYVNEMGKTDFNINLAHKINSKWSTALLMHDDFLTNKTVDYNKDGFRDLPTGNLFNVLNRWQYNSGKGVMMQFGINAMNDNKTGGQVGYTTSDKFTTNNYGYGMQAQHYEAFSKIGYVFPQKKYKSIGLQLSGFTHQQDNYFGFTVYNAQQQHFYSNLIYQSIIGNTNHKFRTGLSFLYDHYNEDFSTTNYKRTEAVSGGFFEYTYDYLTKLSVVAGIRADDNNLYGWFATPRLHVRYEPIKGTSIRVSVGRGQRTANIFAENMGDMVSGRQFTILAPNNNNAYGLQPEVAWNKGISVDQKLKLFHRDATVSVDFYRNDFTNQVVADVEDVRSVKFYNLTGKSFSNSFQTQVDMQPLDHFDVRIAYRFFDVQTTYSGVLLQKPLNAKHRAFLNLAYDFHGWKLDYTFNYNGPKRIPNTSGNPVQYQRNNYSTGYMLMNAQLSKSFGKAHWFDAYVGADNLTNFFQKDAIIAAEQPFSKYFDASLVWGPITGPMFYAGVRYKIK